jgi:hypothetical protein
MSLAIPGREHTVPSVCRAGDNERRAPRVGACLLPPARVSRRARREAGGRAARRPPSSRRDFGRRKRRAIGRRLRWERMVGHRVRDVPCTRALLDARDPHGRSCRPPTLRTACRCAPTHRIRAPSRSPTPPRSTGNSSRRRCRTSRTRSCTGRRPMDTRTIDSAAQRGTGTSHVRRPRRR